MAKRNVARRHRRRFTFAEGLNVEGPFIVGPGAHPEFVIDVDLAQSLHRHQGGVQ